MRNLIDIILFLAVIGGAIMIFGPIILGGLFLLFTFFSEIFNVELATIVFIFIVIIVIFIIYKLLPQTKN